jgi:excisionase family DNA binding protein
MNDMIFANKKELVEEVESILEEKLSKLKSDLQNSRDSLDTFMTIEDCALYTGIPKSTIYQYCSKNLIPHGKVGKHLRFYKEDILNWLKGLND